MAADCDIPVEHWELPGEPFRLAAIAVAAADWELRLSSSAREKIRRFMDPAARHRAGASEWFKTCWLPRQLGSDRVEFQTGNNGKPLLTGSAAEWGFNLSHAGEYAVAVLARGVSIGVDLESMSRPADVERLGERVFSGSEQALVRAGGREAFFTLWSQKEALLKALGCGWADGGIVRRTRLERIPYQVEPATGIQLWSRNVVGGAYALAIAIMAS
ncbi:MAG TPA: 4'-phosphopantetheinyl transferase superfamily protein [Candidatus Paceibacterota bacterium]|nr:4'-phosphopantetheinyl transferase superfamily protein [Candidatus Paceibacterota bacterium]